MNKFQTFDWLYRYCAVSSVWFCQRRWIAWVYFNDSASEALHMIAFESIFFAFPGLSVLFNNYIFEQIWDFWLTLYVLCGVFCVIPPKEMNSLGLGPFIVNTMIYLPTLEGVNFLLIFCLHTIKAEKSAHYRFLVCKKDPLQG